MKIRYLFTIFCVSLTCFRGSSALAQDVPQLADTALAATVYLEMTDTQGKPICYGSGFFVSPTHIVTNFHVVAEAAKGSVKLVNKTKTYPIQGVVAIDQENDLAILKVTIRGIEPLSLGNSEKVRIGERVYVAGNPKGLEGTFSDGIISRITTQNGKKRLQMTAPISPGSSGGPVLNSRGKVIGVAFMTIRSGQNLNFAIPSKYIPALLNDVKEPIPPNSSKEKISAKTYFKRGDTKYFLERYEDAILDYDAAIRLNPGYVEAYNHRGLAKASLGRHKAAISDYDKAIRLNPTFAPAYNNRGITKDELRQYTSAIIDFDKAINIEPDAYIVYWNRALAKYHLGQYTSAISDYGKVIILGAISDDGKTLELVVEAYYNRGVVKEHLGQYASAINDYDKAIKLNPDYVDAYINRGAMKDYLGQYASAINDFNKAIKLNPGSVLAYLNRGIAKEHLGRETGDPGQYASAINDYDKVIRLNPNHAPAYYQRGVAKLVLGQTRRAKQDLQTALKLATQVGDVQLKSEIESVLDQLK